MSFIPVLKAIGRGIGSVLTPQDEEALIRTPPFIPGSIYAPTTIPSSTDETDVEYSGLPDQIGMIPPTLPPAKKPSKVAMIGQLLQGGIDAASTPNVAYGGPTDIFRGMSNAGQMARQREMQDSAQAQTKAKMQADLSMLPMRQREIAAKIKADEALAGYYKARGDAETADMNKPKPRYVSTSLGMFDTETGQYIGRGEKMVKVSADVARQFKLAVPDDVTEVEVPESVYERMLPHINQKPPTETPTEATARRTREADELNLKGDDRVNYIAGRNVIRRESSGGGGRQRQMTPTQAGSIERRKDAALLKAKEKFEAGMKAIKSGSNPLLGGLMGNKSNAPQFANEAEAYNWWNSENQRIQDAYENEIEAATGQPLTPFQYPKKAPVAATQQEETREYMGAIYRKDKKTGQWVRQ